MTRIWPWQRWHCSPPSRPSGMDLKLTHAMVLQFMLITPLLSLLELIPAVSEKPRIQKLITAIELVSLVVAILGLLTLIRALHELLGARRAHSKLFFLKFCFLGGTIIKRIANLSVTEYQELGENCFPAEAISAAWAGAITDVICSLLAAWGCFLFTVDDLNAFCSGPKTLESGKTVESDIEFDTIGQPISEKM
ncbi:unnamed protein product [Polarella glacialis]|uniref:Uncharacterized protein n=1 Tax=Polarella glacialis TaxID=89957 RepID=A0A813FXG5_POLGL|nr:unnamed protein product [Polarella glacialis]CAE8728569.1 unnamed protein product [Polarella glacialis]